MITPFPSAATMLVSAALAVGISVEFGALTMPVLADQRQDATELQAGQEYQAGTRIKLSAAGFSFVVPQHWLGGLPPGAQIIILGSRTTPGFGMVTILNDVTADDVAGQLGESQAFSHDLVFEPDGKVVREGDKLKASFVAGDKIGRALVVMGPVGNAVLYFFGGPATEAPAYTTLLHELAGSTQFFEVTREALVRPWQERLAGKMLRRLSSYSSGTSGGYNSSSTLHLCRDRQFYYHSVSSVSINVPGATAGGGDKEERQGQWRVEMQGTTPMLILADRDGSTSTHPLGYDGEKTFLDGERVFRVQSDACP